MKFIKLYMLAIMVFLSPGMAVADSWPSRDITIIVPFGPGGGMDILARQYQAELEARLPVKVIVKNMPGAATLVAVNHVLSNNNDDHTFVITTDDFLTSTWVEGQNRYNRFAPVFVIGSVPYVVFGGSSASITNLKQQISTNQKVNIGNLGVNGSADIWMSGLVSNLKINAVPYKTRQQLLADILGNHLEYATMSLWLVNQNLSNGVVPLMVSSDTRHPMFPTVPTFRELGIKGESTASWWSVIARQDTSPVAIQSMNRYLREITATNTTIQTMNKEGFEVLNLSLADSRSYMQNEIKKLEKKVPRK